MTRLLLLAIGGAAALLLQQAGAAPADHGGTAGRATDPSPLTVAVIAGLLALAIGIAIVVLLMRLAGKTPRAE